MCRKYFLLGRFTPRQEIFDEVKNCYTAKTGKAMTQTNVKQARDLISSTMMKIRHNWLKNLHNAVNEWLTINVGNTFRATNSLAVDFQLDETQNARIASFLRQPHIRTSVGREAISLIVDKSVVRWDNKTITAFQNVILQMGGILLKHIMSVPPFAKGGPNISSFHDHIRDR